MSGASEITRNMDEWMKRRRAALKALGDAYASKMEAYAKPNAPWKDRTGFARKLLFGEAAEFVGDEDTLKVRISHTMSYGEYLELANQGKYQILRPTRDKFYPGFFRDAKRLVNKK